MTVKTGSEFVTKRVIDLPSELIWMKEGAIFVNGERLEEPFPVKRGVWTVKPGLIEAGKFLLIGDNRTAPEHSFFVVPRENIIARAFGKRRPSLGPSAQSKTSRPFAACSFRNASEDPKHQPLKPICDQTVRYLNQPSTCCSVPFSARALMLNRLTP